MATGRTLYRFCKFQIEDNSSTMRDIPVNAIGNIGLTYEEKDLSAWQDAIKNSLLGLPSFATDISGPLDNSAAVAASGTGARPALSGSHGILSALAGALTPRSFGVYLGIQADWSTGDPVFGGVDCILVSKYTVSPGDGTMTAGLVVASNRTNDPAWGTAAIAAST